MLEDLGKPLDPVIRGAEVEVITGLSKTTIWRKVKAGEFPAPVKISARCRGWRKSALARWLESLRAVNAAAPTFTRPAKSAELEILE